MIELNKLYNEDCRETMKRMPDNSVDSIVTDPPYGISFMNKHWDYEIPSVEIWKEALRVLKPGGHILCACGTRTQHRMTVNIEDAGFEIRDVVAWIYGSGFPKSLNIGKAIDKIEGNERIISGEYQHPDGKPRNWEEHNESKGAITFGHMTGMKREITKGTSEYEGWGTALKPAMELWTLARKPLSEKTVAENVLKWGTGGINIDGCRVETEDNLNGGAYSKDKQNDGEWGTMHKYTGEDFKQPQGRFPANVIHDGSEEVLSGFPNTGGGGKPKTIIRKDNGINNFGIKRVTEYEGYEDTLNGGGSASRFFYCAKADRDERNEGLHQFEKQFDSSRPWCTEESDRGRIATRLVSKQGKNNHPTVKPVKLMQYLQRLITPKGGITYDPFGGSGTSAIAATNEGFKWILSEISAEYCDIANKRIYHNAGLFR